MSTDLNSSIISSRDEPDGTTCYVGLVMEDGAGRVILAGDDELWVTKHGRDELERFLEVLSEQLSDVFRATGEIQILTRDAIADAILREELGDELGDILDEQDQDGAAETWVFEEQEARRR